MFNFFKKNKKLEKLKIVYTDLNKIEDRILFLCNETQNQKYSTYKTVINHLNNNIYGMKLAKDLETKYEMINKLSNEILNIHIEIKNELNEYNHLKYEKEMEKLA